MIDAATTQKDLEAIAQKIDTGNAVTIDPLAERLRDLGKAIADDDPHHDAWAAIDVQRLIEPTLIVERFSNRLAQNRWIRRLQWTRTILIFFPIIFTWTGILLALNASRANDTSGASFISQWQQGFNGNLVWQWTPAGIATVDFTSLILILILTRVIIWLKARDRRKQTREAEQLHTSLNQVLGDASLCLATGRWKAPTNLVSRFDETANALLLEIGQERQRLADLANRREKEFADLGAFTSGVARVTNGMLEAANEMKGTTAYLVQNLRTFSEQYKDVPGQQQMVLLATNTTIQLLQSSLRALEGIEGRQEVHKEALTLSLTRIEEAIMRIMESASNMQSSTQEYAQQQHTFFQNLQLERETQNRVVARVISATESTGKALQELDDGAKDLHIMAVDLNKMRNQLVGFLNSMKDEIFSEMKGAADQISNSSTSLASAAATIEQASQALSQAVTPSSQSAPQLPVLNSDDELTRSVTSKLG